MSYLGIKACVWQFRRHKIGLDSLAGLPTSLQHTADGRPWPRGLIIKMKTSEVIHSVGIKNNVNIWTRGKYFPMFLREYERLSCLSEK